MWTPGLGEKAVAVLGMLGTPESQRALVELASRFGQPLALRQAAVANLQQSINKHGILLATHEIQRQYDRYNQSESLDLGTQRVLSAVLDCLESRLEVVKKSSE
jgi:hypothetical protein